MNFEDFDDYLLKLAHRDFTTTVAVEHTWSHQKSHHHSKIIILSREES